MTIRKFLEELGTDVDTIYAMEKLSNKQIYNIAIKSSTEEINGFLSALDNLGQISYFERCFLFDWFVDESNREKFINALELLDEDDWNSTYTIYAGNSVVGIFRTYTEAQRNFKLLANRQQRIFGERLLESSFDLETHHGYIVYTNFFGESEKIVYTIKSIVDFPKCD